MKSQRFGLCGFLLACLGVALVGCETTPVTQTEKDDLHAEVLAAVADFKRADPSIQHRFDTAHGYTVFPSVTKGGAGLGGAFGQGEYYEGGRFMGYTSLSQGTIGAQLGGQEYSEIIFFSTPGAAAEFKSGDFAFAAQASAVAAKEGASADADYKRGVLVFTMAKGGLMFEASIGGQKFTYHEVPAGERTAVR